MKIAKCKYCGNIPKISSISSFILPESSPLYHCGCKSNPTKYYDYDSWNESNLNEFGQQLHSKTLECVEINENVESKI